VKTDKFQRRFYRDKLGRSDLHLAIVCVGQTDLGVLTDKPVSAAFLRERIKFYRRIIESYIAKDSLFLTSLKPIPLDFSADPIIKEMGCAARLANVGPMASVAGSITQFLGEDLLKRGLKEVIVENGGDIFLKIARTRRVGIYSGSNKLFKNLCIIVQPKDTPMGICTSSGTVGHSLSFGSADSVVILAKSAPLADAVATATGNLVKSKDDLRAAVGFAKSIKGVRAVAVVIGDTLIASGKIKFSRCQS